MLVLDPATARSHLLVPSGYFCFFNGVFRVLQVYNVFKQRHFYFFLCNLDAFYLFFLNCSGQDFHYCIECKCREQASLPSSCSQRKNFQYFTVEYVSLDLSCMTFLLLQYFCVHVVGLSSFILTVSYMSLMHCDIYTPLISLSLSLKSNPSSNPVPTPFSRLLCVCFVQVFCRQSQPLCV